jgi:hypothetical protein
MKARLVHVSLSRQRLTLRVGEDVRLACPVSTARNGAGERYGSECTPRGWHRIRVRIGAGCPPNTVFVGRRPTGERYTPELRRHYPERDWVLTRILWLTGLEPGRNRGGEVDTLRRCIYLHGCPDEVELGAPGSHGCVRLRNADVIRLFDEVRVGDRVFIEE